MSDRKVRDLLAELDRLAVISNAPGVMSLPVRDMAENLRRAVDAPDTPDTPQTISGMEWQWGVEKHDGHRWSRHGGCVGPESIARLRLRKAREDGETARLVRRLVGPVEVAE